MLSKVTRASIAQTGQIRFWLAGRFDGEDVIVTDFSQRGKIRKPLGIFK